jgi:hypothetical protein
MSVEICVKSNAGWKRFTTVTNRIADEDIDGYIAYRKLKPNFNWWRSVGVYQRNLADYSEDVLLHGESFGDGCVNCHTFPGNDPDKMIIGIRGSAYGSATLLARDGKVEKIGAKWGYAAWHPNGKLAVYAIMKVRQFFHRTGMEIRDVVDLDSALLYYDTDERTTKTTPAIADKQRLESYPTWSPDGKYLYFCSAPIPWPNREDLPPLDYEKVKYDLVRVAYDSDTKMWGRRETVLSAQKTGLSILLPRISPDGRYLLFCMCRYGCFPVYQPSSDLYLMDLESGEHRKLAINSPYSESWHSWSSNSRWIAFSSKRRGGLFTRTYVSYVDKSGKVYKPFILPQKDPRFYDSCLETYSVPELITGPVRVDSRQLTLAARAAVSVKVDMPITTATPDSSRVETSEPWQGGRRR